MTERQWTGEFRGARGVRGVSGVRGTGEHWQDENGREWMAKGAKVRSTWQGVPQKDGHLRFDEQGPSEGISFPAWPRAVCAHVPSNTGFFFVKCPGDFVGSALMAAS